MSGTQAPGRTRVAGYEIALDRAYDPAMHMWAQVVGDRVRIGLDPLGVETSGTLAQLGFEPVGTEVRRGDPFGSLEAAKFVGPLVSPLSGTVSRRNEAALEDPSLVERDPFGEGWLVELAPSHLEAELPGLLSEPDEIVRFAAERIEQYRREGVLAE